jgi:hypothetical protein
MLDNARAGVQSSFAVISVKGRVWRTKHRGEETPVLDARGQPVATLEVVIVGVAPNVSKTFYQKGFVEGSDDSPDCFSLDGIAPDATAPKKQNETCATCPQNMWGSRVTDNGKRAKACSDQRRIAVVPTGDILNKNMGGPMLLRLPPTSLPNLASYSDFLERKGADFPYVATRLGFDYDVAYPKVSFDALGYLDDAQAAQVVEVMSNPLIDRMLYEAAPTELGAAVAAGVKPGGQVVPMARPAIGPATVPAAPPVATPQKVPYNPFATAAPAEPAPTSPPPAPVIEQPPTETVEATPARASNRRRQPLPSPITAPPDLAGAIDDLLDEQSA